MTRRLALVERRECVVVSLTSVRWASSSLQATYHTSEREILLIIEARRRSEEKVVKVFAYASNSSGSIRSMIYAGSLDVATRSCGRESQSSGR